MTHSSETGSWKVSGEPLAAKYKTQYDAGVYWNGAVNWFNCWGIGDSVYYNVRDERLGNIPLPPIPEGKDWHNREFRHYGESRGHLHLVEAYDQTHRVDVYELERDYSGWFSKFSVDLDAVGVPRDNPFGILCVVRMERDEESLLVLHVPGKILRCTIFGDGTLNKICDVAIPSRFHINWFSSWGIGDSMYYNVDDEQLGNIPLPPIPEDRTHRVDVYELERDYSGWFSKFSLDLDAVGVPRDTRFNSFGILCVVRMERDEESLLVLHVPGKILRCTILGDGTLNKICDVAIPPRTASAIVSSSSPEEVKSGGVLTASLETNNPIDAAAAVQSPCWELDDWELRSSREDDKRELGTGSWKASGELFAVDFYKYDNSGVYWNGAVHWFNRWRNRDSLYYNVDEERMGIIPAPPARELEIVMVGILCIMGNFGAAVPVRSLVIMGNLGGHLHLVETYRFGPTNQVDVYEMARDYSMWSVKYRVDDLDGVGIVRRPRGCSSISVLCVVRTERDEESFMVLHVPGKILGYGFADGNFKEICGVAAPEGFDTREGYRMCLHISGLIAILTSNLSLAFDIGAARSFFSRAGYYQVHIFNPTTKQLTSLPKPRGESEWRYQIEIYSSETGTWRPSGEPFIGDLNSNFLGGVYWHGAIHWFNAWGDSLYFDIEDERLGILPMPPIPQGEGNGRLFRYYGESRGHLHLVEIYDARTQFCVYEMEADYSGWFVKYSVDLHERTKHLNLGLEFIPLKNGKAPAHEPDDHDAYIKSVTRFPNLSDVIVLNSCHGLLFCLSYNEVEAYDPSESPRYKVVGLWRSVSISQWETYYHIEIYSSETRSWRPSGDSYTVDEVDFPETSFHGGVYWNGAVNWLNLGPGDSLYFHIDQERLGTIPMPPAPHGKWWYDRAYMYYGKSRGHLHLSEMYNQTTG
ncbi:hypothetical protein C3L33_03057, partial [Rhododendron williamsianum]